MDTRPQTTTNNSNDRFFWIISYVAIAFGLLFSFMGLSEFYNIKIAGQESSYAFGPINENQWYYQNASVYKFYNLTSGLIFLVASLFAVWAAIRKNKTFATWGILLIILLLIAHLISAHIE